MKRHLFAYAAWGAIGLSALVAAEPGVGADRILFGQSAAFSGAAQELGQNLNHGIRAAFKEANDAGGVHGRRLDLIALDDQYEPEAAVENTRRLIEDEQIFALIGAVGTPTSRSALPVAVELEVPYIAPFTGAEFLRHDTQTVVNLRASYFQETEAIVRDLVDERGLKRIAIIYQDDSFGRVGYAGTLQAMARRDMELVARGVYPRNTIAVKTALLDIRNSVPDAVVIIGAYRPTAEIVLWARKLELPYLFYTISFVGSNALASQLGERVNNVFVSQVVPLPSGSELVAQEFRAALKRIDRLLDPGFVSFEGYLAGRMTIALLRRTGPELTRAGFMATMRTSDSLDMSGFVLQFGPTDNQGSDAVYLTAIGADGKYRPL